METGANSWSRLELLYLAALEALAEEGSFGRAADRLCYTQSAVSQQIAALERIVGARLAERGGDAPRGGLRYGSPGPGDRRRAQTIRAAQ